jgi:hypothetical protein
VLNGDSREGVLDLSAVALYTVTSQLAVWGQVISISLDPVKNQLAGKLFVSHRHELLHLVTSWLHHLTLLCSMPEYKLWRQGGINV